MTKGFFTTLKDLSALEAETLQTFVVGLLAKIVVVIVLATSYILLY